MKEKWLVIDEAEDFLLKRPEDTVGENQRQAKRNGWTGAEEAGGSGSRRG